jgi:hypothetical protein
VVRAGAARVHGYERTSLGPEWYADALMLYRKRGSRAASFLHPDHNNIPGQKNHAVWIDIFVPEGARRAARTLHRGLEVS